MSDNDPLSQWRQGDFAFAVGGFLFASAPSGNDAFDASEETEGIVGLVAISQTCDIVRQTGGRHYVTVCPLVRINDQQKAEVVRGRRPYFTEIENAGEDVIADLRRVMSVEKKLLRKWNRQDGFCSDQGRIRFAAALERKFGQFAFPDEFDQAIVKFRQRVWSRHSKDQSPPGKIYRSLTQIRFRATPNWSAAERMISVIAILMEEQDREASREQVHHELKQELAKIAWPDGYVWAEPEMILGTAIELSAEDVMSSQRGDFDFLCY